MFWPEILNPGHVPLFHFSSVFSSHQSNSRLDRTQITRARL